MGSDARTTNLSEWRQPFNAAPKTLAPLLNQRIESACRFFDTTKAFPGIRGVSDVNCVAEWVHVYKISKRLPATHENSAIPHNSARSRKCFEMKGARGRVQGLVKLPVDQGYRDNYDKMTRYIVMGAEEGTGR